jgi:hypothetical protein
MKKYIYLFILTAFVIAGCKKDFLKLEPTDTQTKATFFKTESQFRQAVNGAYAPLQGLYNSYFWAMAEMRSDNTSFEYDDQDRSTSVTYREDIDEFRELNNNETVSEFFGISYSDIGRCNLILLNLPKAKLSPGVADTIGGQASFLRAFNYFNLVRMYGDIPLITTEITSISDAYNQSKKTSAANIYTQIIADATDAIAKLPLSYSSPKDKGRATKGAAETMLAEVYMTQHKFDLAIPLLREVINSNAYGLNDNYADNFNILTKNSKESIFEIQYIEGPNGLGSDFVDTFIPWDYYDTDITGHEITNGAPNGWNIPTQDLLNKYEDGDKRRDASITDFTSDEYGIELPFIKKYQSIGAQPGITANNFPVYRYADVYLMLAECLNEQGYAAGGDAFIYLNKVRFRAGVSDRTADNVPNQEAFRAAIAQERQVELAFENHRWFDLLRTGKAVEVMTAHAVHERAYKSDSWPIGASAYSNIRLLYQYPLNEELLEHQ